MTVTEASIVSSLHYNVGVPPKVRWCINMPIAPLDLGDDAAYPELETIVDSAVSFDELDLDIEDWRELANTFEFSSSQNGSFYVTSAHNPVDAIRLTITDLGNTLFQIAATARFCFEFEQSGYQDAVVDLNFTAKYVGFHFCVPTWTDPNSVILPAEYGVPSMQPDWTHQEILSFVAQHLDLSQFDAPLITNHKYLELAPKPAI
jgi:hypothetical protein